MDSSPTEMKGTVTPLSSLFPADEAQKASKRVQEAISERQQQLGRLKDFINDNVNLINLVQKLPDEIGHHIMVPFGKAAFFPGRLIHTNVFMVLLGEGYYSERTSKQTAEILKRRGKALETEVESLKAIMQDIRAEASFFDATAYEAAEGLVDIKEVYDEEGSSKPLAAAEEDEIKTEDDDEEYTRIFSRIAELEKEEEEAEKANDSDEHELMHNELDDGIRQISIDQVRSSQVEASERQAVSKDVDGSPHENYPAANSSMMTKALEVPEVKKRVQAPVTASSMKQAFTGSIVEHPPQIGMTLTVPQTGTQSSKPVSRFKLQRK